MKIKNRVIVQVCKLTTITLKDPEASTSDKSIIPVVDASYKKNLHKERGIGMNSQKYVMIPAPQYDRMVASYDKAMAELEELRKLIKNMAKGGTENE